MSGPYVLTENPPNAGVRLADQTGLILAQSEMYMRNNFPLPEDLPDSIEVIVPGGPARALGVADLAGLPQRTVSLVLECAGNGRTLMQPVPEGTPWDLGGASVIEVTGPRLSDVIGILPEKVVEVVLTGADSGEVEPEGRINYQFSLARDLIESGRAIVATHIGGEPLDRNHGAPARVIVPGHYAMKSVKWLTGIRAVTKPFRGHFVEKYRFYEDLVMPEAAPVGPIRVRSIISAPMDGQAVTGPNVTVIGSAWSGSGPIAKVDITVDRGETWMDARLGPQPGEFAAASWSCPIQAPPGPLSIAVRAVDSAGNTQPLQAGWNRNGYANNAVHSIDVVVT